MARNTHVEVVKTNAWRLPESSKIVRSMPRPVEARQEGYEELFDATTVFYDVFWEGDRISLCGPPVRNLARELNKSVWKVGKAEVRPTLYDRARCQESHAVLSGRDARRARRRGTQLTVSGPFGNATIPIAPSKIGLFEGRRTLLTLSKNNDLAWIRDWGEFYVREHGVEAVLLYDNGSDIYTPADVADTLAAVDGLEVVVVVDFDFPYGPRGGPQRMWDSDFLQYAVMDHARSRFLNQAEGVINADIDELIICDDRGDLYEKAARSRYGVVIFEGVWVEKAIAEQLDADRVRRYVDYLHVDPTSPKTTKKWCLIPKRMPRSAQWRVHSISDLPVPVTTDIRHRHFKGINTNWKYERQESRVEDLDLQRDDLLARVLSEVFPNGRAS